MSSVDDSKSFFKSMLQQQYDEGNTQRIYNGCSKRRCVTLRINTIKAGIDQVKAQLQNEGIEFMSVPWSDTALVIKDRNEKDLQCLDIYKNGDIYLQSLSSMLPPIIMEPQPNEDILDMAAAPGGKTTQIAALTQNMAHITACEMNAIRAERLMYNVEKQGAVSVYVMQKDSRSIDDLFSFDRILLDAPCSGSGTLDMDNEDSFKYFSQKLVERSTNAQIKLLEKALKILKPGKEMVYSTCSIFECENEDVVSRVLDDNNAEIVPIVFNGMDALPLLPVKIHGTVCVCPDEFYEGFFIAKIRRK